MEVQRTASPQFGSRFIARATVQQKINRRWEDMPVNLVKFDAGNKMDRLTINFLSLLWNGGKNLSGTIAEEAGILRRKSQIYALTTQKDDFKHLDINKILGIMSTDKVDPKTKTAEIFKIGTDPQYAYEQNKRNRDIRHIAKAMVDSFSKKVAKPFVSYAEPQEVKFLEKVNLSPKSKDVIEFIG